MATFTVNTHHAYLNNKIVIETKDWITIEDISTGLKYQFKKVLVIKLSAGLHILKSDDHEEEIVIEDAIKLGGSKIKYAFVFDDMLKTEDIHPPKTGISVHLSSSLGERNCKTRLFSRVPN